MTEKPDAVHMIHINAPPQAVWDAITDPERASLYFFGCRWEFGPVGGDFRVWREDGSLDSEGEVLVRDEPACLRVTWKIVWLDAPPGEVDWTLEDLGGVTRLTVREYGRAVEMAPYEDQARQGWSLILSGLKTLLETGKPMPQAMPQAPAEAPQ